MINTKCIHTVYSMFQQTYSLRLGRVNTQVSLCALWGVLSQNVPLFGMYGKVLLYFYIS